MATFSRTLRARCVTGLLYSILVLTALGCGVGFDSPDKVETLRVFGVRKDYPYAAPTVDTASPSEVHMTMLSHDGSSLASDTSSTSGASTTGDARTVQRLWFSGCDDLPGDEYFSCLLRIDLIWREWEKWSPLHPEVQLTEGTSWSVWNSLKDKSTAEIEALLQILNSTLPFELSEQYFDTYRIGAGERFTYTIPPGIIENHRSTTDSKIPPYGLAFVFFTACAGNKPNLFEAPEWKDIDPTSFGTLTNATLGFPLICKDDAGNTLDSDNFIAGYTQQYVYGDGSANKNPVIEDTFMFDNKIYKFRPDISVQASPADAGDATDAPDAGGAADAGGASDAANAAAAIAAALCLNDDCVPDSQASTDACDAKYKTYVPHVNACKDHCPTYELKPVMIADNNNDIDTFTSAGGSPVHEQMWIDYYANQGTLKGSARSLRDTTLGWLDDYGQKWTPPASADQGPALLWAVVHDNRGGVAWLRVQVCIDP